MAFEDKEAELGLLLTLMQNEPRDRHEIYLQIRQTLNELKSFGMPLPKDLVQFEQDLEAEFTPTTKIWRGARACKDSSRYARDAERPLV